jgi:hypothetical protein
MLTEATKNFGAGCARAARVVYKTPAASVFTPKSFRPSSLLLRPDSENGESFDAMFDCPRRSHGCTQHDDEKTSSLRALIVLLFLLTTASAR